MSANAVDARALQSAAERAVQRALAAGADQAEACVEGSRSFSVAAGDGAIETLKQSATRGLGLRVVVGDAIGFVTTTDLGDARLEDIARRAVALARFSTPDPCNRLVTPDEALGNGAAAADDESLQLFDPAVLELTAEQRIDWALTLERIARAHDPRITRTDGVRLATQDGASAIANSNGVSRAWRGTAISTYVVALAADVGGKQQSGGYGVAFRWLADVPPLESVAREAAKRAIERIGARTVATARVPVVLAPEVAASWLAEMHEAFSGESVLKQSSWLGDKLGQAVASPQVTLVDDGRRVRGIGTEPWDGEGVATRRNLLIERGRLECFLYDSYHARRAGTRPTGSAVRGYSSVPGIGSTNLYLEAGEPTPEQIVAGVKRGFLMTDQGSFGFNPVTGDYSYQAQGFWIENGERAFPVDGVTVASNSLDMLKNLTAVGNDLKFEHAVASPTMLIAEMTVSGGG